MSDKPIAWGMPRPDGTIIDCITPEEHAREPGQYTVPLYAAPQPKAGREWPHVWGCRANAFGECDKGCIAPQPKAEPQGPVAWIEHEWSGSGLKHLHFERRDPTVRDEVVCPIWTPLYAAPQPRRRLTDQEIKDVFFDMGQFAKVDLKAFARAIEAAVWGEKT
jgi:hypothetical protein